MPRYYVEGVLEVRLTITAKDEKVAEGRMKRLLDAMAVDNSNEVVSLTPRQYPQVTKLPSQELNGNK